MRENGIEPNEFSYTAAANACARTGDWEGALRLLEQMRERDEIEPNEFTYTAAVRASVWPVSEPPPPPGRSCVSTSAHVGGTFTF